jgi:hypothetical protein
MNWPQLLQDFGPFALLPFAVIIIERLAAKRARDQKLPENTRNRVYAFAWILIFGLCMVVVALWFVSRTPKPKEAMMRGRITGLGSRQQLRATGPDIAHLRVFTYRDPQEPDRLFWRAISADELDDGTELTFLINDSTQVGEQTFGYPFQASRNFYDYSKELVFKYDSAKNVILFDEPVTGSHHELKGQPIVVTWNMPLMFERAISQLPGFRVLLAQSQMVQQPVRLSPGAVIANLDSDDTLVRLTARRQLAALGPEATSAMDRALVDRASSYRVRLGVIVAAIQMPGFKPNGFSTAAWCEVWNATQTSDDTLKTQANLLLKKQATPVDLSSCNMRGATGGRPPAQQGAPPAQPEIELLNTRNTYAVVNNPPRPPTFQISKRHLISYVWDYHWNNGRGQIAGKIGLRNDEGQMFGPWQAYGSAGQGGAPNVSWEAIVNVTLPPGKYTVVDSDPLTWSWNQQSGGGMSIVKGRPVE